jgi:hypothetical protein
MTPAPELLRDPRARRVSLAVLVALGAALVLAALSGSGTSTATGRLGGDHVEFYGTGKMVLDGQLDELYEPDAQRAAQAPYAGEGGGFLYFGYPPHVAVLYAPLAALPFRASWVVTTALMVGAALGALALLRPVIPVLRTAWWPCVALSLTFVPLFVGVGLGQNTGLSLLLVAATWRLLHDDRDLAAGTALGLLLFKPQLAIPLLVFVLAAQRWRAVASAAAVGIATWVAGALILGPDWVSQWLDGLSAFGEIDKASNAANAVALLGVVDRLLGGGTAGTAVAGLLDVALLAAVAWLWHRRAADDLSGAFAVAVPAAVLIAPHALYYDAGLIVLTGLVVLNRLPRSLPWVFGAWLLGLAQVLAEPLGQTPVVLAVVLALVGGAMAVGRPDLAGTGGGDRDGDGPGVALSSRS